MIEDMENKIRNTLNEIYFGKTKDVVNGLRSTEVLADQKQKVAMKEELINVISKRNVKAEWIKDWQWDWIVDCSLFEFEF